MSQVDKRAREPKGPQQVSQGNPGNYESGPCTLQDVIVQFLDRVNDITEICSLVSLVRDTYGGAGFGDKLQEMIFHAQAKLTVS